MQQNAGGINTISKSAKAMPTKYSKELRPNRCIMCRRPPFLSSMGTIALIPAVKVEPIVKKKPKTILSIIGTTLLRSAPLPVAETFTKL